MFRINRFGEKRLKLRKEREKPAHEPQRQPKF